MAAIQATARTNGNDGFFIIGTIFKTDLIFTNNQCLKISGDTIEM